MKIRQIRIISLALALSFPAAAYPQTAPTEASASASLDWMLGNWTGKGKLFGRDSQVELSVAQVAGGSAYGLDYRILVPASDGKAEMRFAAHGFFQKGKGVRWNGRWVDNFGNLHDISGKVDHQMMLTVWGSPATEIGRSSYSIVGGQMQIVDWSLGRDGVFNEFARSQLDRK